MNNKFSLVSLLVLILNTPLFSISQTACATFKYIDASFTASSNEIIYSESSIAFRFIDGFNGPAFSEVTIGPLAAWNGIYGNDNFNGSKIQWAYAKTNILVNDLSSGFKTITFDYNSYGEKIIMEDIQVWAQGNYTLTYDTTSLVNGGIVTITGVVDSIGIGASFHNDYVVDNICVEYEAVGLNEEFSSSFSIYPNPSDDEITIYSNISILGRTYSIYDETGMIISTGKIDNNSTTMNLSGMNTGLYILEIEGYGQGKFVIDKN
jgi:hypothetical protein